MKLKIILIIIISLVFSSLMASYDEKKILLKNASDMIKVRKYNLAEELYQEAITKFPNDIEVIVAMLELYIRANKGEEGSELLADKSKMLPKSIVNKYEITFLLIAKKNDLALTKAKDFLKENSSQAEYMSVGGLFQRYRAYSEATELFIIAEKLYPNQFIFVLADSYYFERDYDNSLQYYLLALEHNVGNSNLINSRIRSIINQSPNSITVLIRYFGSESKNIQVSKDNISIINVYVDALLNTGRKKIALELLSKYEAKDIYTKAEQFKRLKKYDISKILYELALEKVGDTTLYYRYTYNFADMLFESGSYAESDSLIGIILTEDDQRAKRNIMFDTYLLKAEIVNRNKDLSNQYETLLNKAEKFALNNSHKKTIKAKLSYYKILKEEYGEAKAYIDALGNYGYDDNYFFNYYLYEAFQDGQIADSLATELVIFSSDSPYTNEMLELKYILKSLQQNNKKQFLDAYRAEKLYLIEKADSLYVELYQNTKNEYFVIRNGLINKDNKNYQRAGQLFSQNFTDDFCHDFAAMQLIFMEDENSQLAKDMARNFLTQYPNSSFAAQVRQILMTNQNE